MYKIYLKQNNEKKKETMKSKAWIIAAPFSGSFFELYLPTSDVNEREPVCACQSHRCHPERTRRRRRTEADLLPSVPNGATAEPQPTPYISTRDIISFLSWSSGAVHETDWTLSILYSVCLYMTICCLHRVWRPRESSRLESRICIMFFCSFLLWHYVLRCVFMVGRWKSLGYWVYR